MPKVTQITDARAGTCPPASLYIKSVISGDCLHYKFINNSEIFFTGTIEFYR